MAVSPGTATAFLSIPPVRGAVSLLMLFIVTGVSFDEGDLSLGGRIALGIFGVLLGVVVWVMTLSGFVRDVREPRRLGDDAVVVAHRPRRLARILSWSALGVVIFEGLALGPMSRYDLTDLAVLLLMFSFVVALLVASLLPRVSRWYADGAGVVAVSPAGLSIVADDGDAAEVLPWRSVGAVGPSPSVAESLSIPAVRGIGRRVRWRPGAQEAVARWAEEGFAPSADEVSRLQLDPQWSPDPNAHQHSRLGRWGFIAFQGWALLVSVLLAGAMIWAVAVGEAEWWILVLLGWAPLLGFVILAPRFVRILRTDERRAARLSAAGWIDKLHGQGLVRWTHIDRIEVRGRHTLVVKRAGAPPSRDRDLGNRMNNWLIPRMEKWPRRYRIPGAGPLFREIGPRHQPYSPETRAFELAEDAERLGYVDVRRGKGADGR